MDDVLYNHIFTSSSLRLFKRIIQEYFWDKYNNCKSFAPKPHFVKLFLTLIIDISCHLFWSNSRNSSVQLHFSSLTRNKSGGYFKYSLHAQCYSNNFSWLFHIFKTIWHEDSFDVHTFDLGLDHKKGIGRSMEY